MLTPCMSLSHPSRTQQLPLAHQLGLYLPLPPPTEVDSPSKRIVRSTDMYLPSRVSIKSYASSTPLKDVDPQFAEPEFLLSDDEMDAPRARSPRRARADMETHQPRKPAAATKKRSRSKSRGRKTVRAVK